MSTPVAVIPANPANETLALAGEIKTLKSGAQSYSFTGKKAFVEQYLAANPDAKKADANREHFRAKGEFMRQNGAALSASIAGGMLFAQKITRKTNGNVNVSFVHKANLAAPKGSRVVVKTLAEYTADELKAALAAKESATANA